MTNANLPDVVVPSGLLPANSSFPPADDRDGDDGDGAIDWRRIRSAIVRYKWLVLAVTLLGTAGGIGATRLIRPVYAAQAKIWIDVEGRRDPDRGPTPIRARRLLDPESWVDLLESYVVLDQVVRDQRLYLEPHSPADAAPLQGLRVAGEFRPGTYRYTLLAPGDKYTLASEKGEILDRGRIGDSVGRALGFQWVPSGAGLTTGHGVDFTLSTLRDAATQLAGDLDARMDLDGNFMRVELRGTNPARITAIVNAVAARFVQVEADLKRQKVTELTKILGDQVQQSQQNLRTAEDALQRYREQTITLPNERPALTAPVTGSAGTASLSTAGGVASAGGVERSARDPVAAGYFDLQAARDQAHRDRLALTRLLDESKGGGITADGLLPIGAVKDDENLRNTLKELTAKQADLRALQYKYEDQYPPIQRLLEDIRTIEQETLPEMVRSLVQQLATREGDLSRRLEADSKSLRQIPERAITEARLRREATLAENLYASLEQQYEEARLAEASTVPDVRLLDGAVEPQRPVKNTAPRLIFLGSLGSLALAIMGAVLIDRMDPRVRYPEQVSREMGLTILGSVPFLRSPARSATEGNGRPRESEHAAVTVEALRGVCLNLAYAHGAAMPMLLTITSPGPGDGKSFLVSNLGRTFGEAGHRVLIIDGDIPPRDPAPPAGRAAPAGALQLPARRSAPRTDRAGDALSIALDDRERQPGVGCARTPRRARHGEAHRGHAHAVRHHPH